MHRSKAAEPQNLFVICQDTKLRKILNQARLEENIIIRPPSHGAAHSCRSEGNPR